LFGELFNVYNNNCRNVTKETTGLMVARSNFHPPSDQLALAIEELHRRDTITGNESLEERVVMNSAIHDTRGLICQLDSMWDHEIPQRLGKASI
jgi:hypothetical protein